MFFVTIVKVFKLCLRMNIIYKKTQNHHTKLRKFIINSDKFQEEVQVYRGTIIFSASSYFTNIYLFECYASSIDFSLYLHSFIPLFALIFYKAACSSFFQDKYISWENSKFLTNRKCYQFIRKFYWYSNMY